MTLFVENEKSKFIENLCFGVIQLNIKTVKEANHVSRQNMATDQSIFIGVKQSILEKGYNPAFPIVLDSTSMTTIDGFTRLKASIELVEEGMADEILIPFYTAIEKGTSFNPATRGASADDITYLFKIARHNGLLTGGSKRAAEQAIEASQMLDVAKLEGNFTKSFDSTRTQCHTSKIVRESESFILAYRAVCEISTAKRLNPDNIKWAHWMALFCRYGVSNATKSIALQNTIENKGTTQQIRYDVFIKCCEKAIILGGL